MNPFKIKNKYLKLFRLFDWIYILGIPMLGFTYAYSTNFRLSHLFLILLVSSLYLAHGYSINEVFDTLIKYKKSHSQFIKEKWGYFRKAVVVSFIPLLINLFITILISKTMFLLVALGAVLSYLYSAPPTRLKARPFIDLICNSLGFSILFLIGYCSIKSLDAHAILITILFFPLFIILQLIHEIAHLKQDKSENTSTTVVRYGIKTAVNLIFISLCAFICWALLLWLRGMSIFIFLLSSLFTLYIGRYLIKRYDKETDYINIVNLRIHIRFISIVYGLGILIIFLCSQRRLKL